MPGGGVFVYNVTFKRKGGGHWIYAQGEVTNNLGKNYHTALLRLSVFNSSMIMWTGIIKIAGFRKGQTKTFDILKDGLRDEQVPLISRYDIYFEGGY